MTFHSTTFAIFFAVVVTLYYASPHGRRVPVLLAASVLFYLSFIPQYIFILLALITVDYCAGLLIERAQSAGVRKTWLALSLTANLGLMFAFKYSPDVFGRSFGAIPVGLSFHTFQAMAYTIEVYRGRQAAERSFTVYALYVMFFPQIAAGPIERPQDLLPQFRKPHLFSYVNAVSGLQLMAWGMFQKYVVAERLSTIVNALYADHSRLSGPTAAFAAACFSFQIFCDFAGYSDIALGAAEVLGIRLTRNFNSPFHADSMAEYWKRWHISLSSWMRDYVFFPLCGKRPGMPRICGSIVVVFMANGLWHGIRWNYLISGLLHGTYRVTELVAGRAMSRAGWSINPFWSRPVRIARTLLVFSLMTFAFLFFRGDNLGQTLGVVSRIFSGWTAIAHPSMAVAQWAEAGITLVYVLAAIYLIGIVEAVQFLRASGPLRPRVAALPAVYRWSAYYAIAAFLLLAGKNSVPFIYFQF
jgi:alginate O-acetyltransferase complex protein AlgI